MAFEKAVAGTDQFAGTENVDTAGCSFCSRSRRTFALLELILGVLAGLRLIRRSL